MAVTRDGGAHFTVVAGPDSHPVLRAHIDSFNAAHWFCLTQAALYQSHDNGGHWSVMQAAHAGETFVDWGISRARAVIAMTGGRLLIDNLGVQQTLPTLSPSIATIEAITAGLEGDVFYCYDDQQRTFKHSAAGSTGLVQLTSLPSSVAVQPRSLVGDRALQGLFYFAGGAGGCWKTLDSFGSANYVQIRKPGVGTSPSGAVYTQLGADGRLVAAPATPPSTPVTFYSDTTWKCYKLWSGASALAEPVGWEAFEFDDTSWPNALNVGGSISIGLAGCEQIWSVAEGTDPFLGAVTLFRKHFTLPAGTVTSFVIMFVGDSFIRRIGINGIYIGAQPYIYWPGSLVTGFVAPTISVPSSLLKTGDNVITMYVQNDLTDDPPTFAGGGLEAKVVYA